MAAAKTEESNGGLRHQMGCWLAALRTHYLIVLVFTVIVYFPRLMFSYFVFFVGQFLRFIARVLGVAGRGAVSNRRILIVTDYLPPQTHGIAVRCDAYVKEMRAQGHEVIVFSTAGDPKRATSFDHPNIPSVVNPFNLKNRIGYNPGAKLAWYLGSQSWDVVHVFCPSLVSIFVCSVCAWRRIPVYSSHHVEVEIFARKLVPVDIIYNIGMCFYKLLCLWPSIYWGTLNAAPTLVFAKAHCGAEREKTLRCVPSGTHNVFNTTPDSPTERRDVRLARFKVDNETTKVILMVQRLSHEKGTERIFPALLNGEIPKDTVLVLAGDGPARNFLEREAQKLQLNAIFLGNVPHNELPALYRAADCFVTMSLSETFGLTSLEAVMCGCPAVMPFCDVFNEIWNPRLPMDWRYNIESTAELAKAVAAAQQGREYLDKHPVNMTWKIAATELLGQYEECIKLNEESKAQLRYFVKQLDYIVRGVVLGAISLLILSRYYVGLRSFGNMLSRQGLR
eukprot:TRINITY_DN8402_c0_g1_i1.p1 TRINITY_DN8402_c0_g1~~TRINITY_DN8402_c0_g1_i1.p1  ORF type:complete len:507 (-),score=92.20 TRINITY_DN8402_c0_g1_i1:358-1878(-)